MSDWLPNLDPNRATPLYEQIIEAVAISVAAGELRPGDRLPSVRTLASRLRLNPNTTARALRELERSGLARAERGIGMRVTEEAARVATDLAQEILDRDLAVAVEAGQRLRLDENALVEALRRVWRKSGGKRHEHD